MKNNQLLIVLLSALLVSLSGCGRDHKDIQTNKGEPNVVEYTIKGVPIECISIPYRLSCNWEKYNELKKAN
jgi:hypothetical protein